MENVILHEIYNTRYPICIASTDEFVELSETPHETRPHSRYDFAYPTSDIKHLESDVFKNSNNSLFHILNCLPSELVRPDALHTLLLGMLVHLMKWVQEVLYYIGRINAFDSVWSRLVPYLGCNRTNNSYCSGTQWQDKGLLNLLLVLLVVFTAALSRISEVDAIPARYKTLCQRAVLCVRYISDFILIAPYQLDTTGTIESMQDYLTEFHKHKDVFLPFRGNMSRNTAAKEAARDMCT